MGQFKPMVKMKTTEPSVELKLASGGHVQKMQAGGPPAPVGARPPTPPARPSMATRRRAMMMRPPGAAPAGPVGMAGRMMKEGGGAEAKLKKHASMPASKAHKGLKTGGVVAGQGGFKEGGGVTGGVSKGNAGGFKKGGAAKKAFATGGLADAGRPVAMPSKPPSKPVSINRLAGTFKSGGKVG